MIDVLQDEYITFLAENNLLEPLVTKIQEYAGRSTKGLNSIENLEQLVDILLEQNVLIAEEPNYELTSASPPR